MKKDFSDEVDFKANIKNTKFIGQEKQFTYEPFKTNKNPSNWPSRGIQESIKPIQFIKEYDNINDGDELPSDNAIVDDEYDILFYHIIIFKIRSNEFTLASHTDGDIGADEEINSAEHKNVKKQNFSFFYNINFNSQHKFPSWQNLKKAFIEYLITEHVGPEIERERIYLWTFKDLYYHCQKFTEIWANWLQKDAQKELGLYLWINASSLQKLAPLFFDSFIEEIYLLPNNSNIIVDHVKYGRIRTSYSCTPLEIEVFLRKIARDNAQDLNKLKPSFRGDFVLQPYFQLRITGDIPPYAIESPSANIRKLRPTPFIMQDLVDSGSISNAAARFLEYICSQGCNITIIGSPGAGKTTLQTALVNQIPEHWRILSFEQNIEFVPKKDKNRHLIRYKFPKYQSEVAKITIFLQLNHMLHRSPDYVNLGEVTTTEEALAWHQILSAGIPSIQTMHAAGIQSIIPRITEIFSIPSSLLLASRPHFFVEIKKIWQRTKIVRKVTLIAELICSKDNNPELSPIFEWKTEENKLELKRDFETLEMWAFIKSLEKRSHLKILQKWIESSDS